MPKNNPDKDLKSRMMMAIFFGLVMTAMGAVCGAFFYKSAVLGFQSANWPSVTGSITYSDQKWESTSSGSAPTQRKWNVDIRYVYEVNGKTYQNDQAYFIQDGFPTSDWKNAKLKRFRKGTTHQVYYDPQKPAISVLEPGAKGKWVLAIGIFIFSFLFFGLVALKGGISDLITVLKNK